jgi:hypothetical protein
MSTIFENSMTTRKYVNGPHEPLGVDDAENEVVAEGGNCGVTPLNNDD